MRYILTAVALGFLATPAFADSVETGLSFTQVQHELGGYNCAGSSCSQSTDGSRQQVYGVPGGTRTYLGPGLSRCGAFIGEFDKYCTILSLVRGTGGGHSTTSMRSIATTDTIIKVLGFDGRTGTFTIDTSTSSVDK